MATATAPETRTPVRPPDEPGPFARTWLPVLLLATLIGLAVAGLVWLIQYIQAAEVVEAGSGNVEKHFVLRRFEEPLKLFGKQFEAATVPWFWSLVLAPVLVLGLVYVVWMYIRDGRAVGWAWATFLGALRGTVYVLLAGVFLLPAVQTWEKSEATSRVLLIIDLSGSMGTTDEYPTDTTPLDKLPTRLDKVTDFLTDEQAGFLAKIMEKNPIVLYGFGGQLDEDFKLLTADRQPGVGEAGRSWWQTWLHIDPQAWLLEGFSPSTRQAILDTVPTDPKMPAADPVKWCEEYLRLDDKEAIPSVLVEAEKSEDEARRTELARLQDRRARLNRRLELRSLMRTGTNPGEAILNAVNREANNMLAGIIVLSDGRQNLGDAVKLDDLRTRLSKARIPLFAVAVGEDRPPVAIRITDLQAPERAPPDDRFPIRIDIDGEGLPDKDFEVTLDLFPPDADQPAMSLKKTEKFKVQPGGDVPHSQVEFMIDPADEQFASLRKKDPMNPKPELEEGEWRLVARVPKDARERFADKEHVTKPTSLHIVKRPLRILMLAGGPTREYQFARTLFVREMDRQRAELSIYLQTYNKTTDTRVQDIDPNRLLDHFPNALRVEDDPTEKPEEKYYNLAQYDLIIAFDVDWTQAAPEELMLLQRWVDTQAGGLILVGGPINTYQVIRGVNYEKVRPILELYPVVLDDNRLQGLGVTRTPDQPWQLNFHGITPELEFLKLDETGNDPVAGWEEFFFGAKKTEGGTPVRGFYNYYPVKSTKPGAGTVASYADPRGRLADGTEQPFLVNMPYGKGKVVYISSGEFWRLRQFRAIYHERFWTKLARYASSGTQTRITRRGVLVMGRQFTAGRTIRMEAQLFDASLNPLPQNSQPEVTLTPLTAGVDLKKDSTFKMKAKAGQGEWTGWFEGRFLLRQPGEYKLDLLVPGSSDVLTTKFLVAEANLEMDNTRPDLALMEQLAGTTEELQVASAREEFRKQLAPRARDRNNPKLLYDLQTAAAIPDGLISTSKTQRSRGPHDDLWDDGINLAAPGEKPRILSTVLLIVVGLLSLEWLSRKLLKLA